MKASDLFVKSLENEGVEYIFAVPGEENLDLLQSIKNSSIRLILTRHEQGAGFMAATYGRLTGKPGVCMATLGPGATNLVTPAAFAQLGGMPLLLITGQKPIKKSKQARFQIIDVVDMMRPITKFTKSITHAHNIPSLVRESFRIAVTEKPGAVHLELPEDVARETSDEALFTPERIASAVASKSALQKAVEMIEAAKAPLVLIGAGANRKQNCEALANFIDHTGFYFFTTQMGKGVIDERHPHYLGTAALSSDDFLHQGIEQADLIINIGHDIIEKPPFFMKVGGKKVIHINYHPSEIDAVYFPQLNVVGDIFESVSMLSELLQPKERSSSTHFKEVKENVSKHLSKYLADTRFPMLPQRLVHLLRQNLNEQDVVSLDNGIYKLWFARNYPAYQHNTLLLDNALATMGAGLPSAMAVNLLYPERTSVAVVGDGGFMMNSQELETAVRLSLNLIVIILNDEAYGMIKWKQEDLGLDDFGLDYKNPDFVKYAESYGAKGYRATSDNHFQEILNSCLQSKGVQVIDLPVDYSLNHEILNVLIKQKQS
ncbi:acetolactate synthase large subunit [Mongoliitalea daihaiensis]|uniref:acetolactate synthase large subunit n=1 Tax=Mongoliitalea daihaiensis TaxID=2782006 RepID=UPI001F2E58D6|nr:acetolactate synthase large subunit [Mongoliitalea daihaiensis]UJP64489.1 acetolactate synthase large subunit [Mongoliitalea daihaiensis]